MNTTRNLGGSLIAAPKTVRIGEEFIRISYVDENSDGGILLDKKQVKELICHLREIGWLDEIADDESYLKNRVRIIQMRKPT